MLVPTAPIHYTLELTPKCNNRCIGCGDVFPDQPVSYLSAIQWQEVLKQLSPHVAHLRLTGGEPTLHPEFEGIIEAIGGLGISFVLLTNARWQDPDGLIGFLHNIPQCKGLVISLHGATPSSHEAFTQVVGSFAETVNNIRRAVAAGLMVSTSTVITKANCSQINDIIAFSAELGAERAVFARYLPVRSDGITPTCDQLREVVSTVEAQRRCDAQVEFSLCIPQCFAPSSSVGCLSGVTYCVVDPWGNVRPCTHASLACGSLLEQSIEEIWHGLEMQRWREMIPAQCHDCLEFPKCHGGCRAAAMMYGLEKDPLIGEPILERAQELHEGLMLYGGAYPIPHFEIRSESFGYLLVRGNVAVPVARQAKLVLDALDGRSTLRQIGERFGQEALNFVGELYKKGIVEMK